MELSLVVLLLVAVPFCSGFPRFLPLIPNVGSTAGDGNSNVPSPFVDNGVCQSIGHMSQCFGPPAAGGNPFGQAFLASMNWTAVCPMDSDGDGLSNGYELGDPYCVWTMGAMPNRTTQLSHPGFACSITTDPHCQGNSTLPPPTVVPPPPPTPTVTTGATLPPPPLTIPPPPPRSTLFPPTPLECLTGVCGQVQTEYRSLVSDYRSTQAAYEENVRYWREDVVSVWQAQQSACSTPTTSYRAP